MRSPLLIPVLVLVGVLVLAQQASAQSTADPLQLPTATRQIPDWQAYAALNNGLGVIGAGANFSYLDPATGVRVTKISSGSFPVSNNGAQVDYSEGGPFISRQWGNGQHTILIHVLENDGIAHPWLGDYQRGVGVTNWRRFKGDPVDPGLPRGPYPPRDVSTSFSNDPATPRIMYYVVDAGKLFRYNTATNTEEAGGVIPSAGLDIAGATGGYLKWMQSSRNDDWFTFMWTPDCQAPPPRLGCLVGGQCGGYCVSDCSQVQGSTGACSLASCAQDACCPRHIGCLVNNQCGSYCVASCSQVPGSTGACTPCVTGSCCPAPKAYAVRRSDGLTRVRDSVCMDEPHLDRDGRFLLILDGGAGECGLGSPFEEYWHLWDLSTDPGTVTCRGPVYAAHTGWARGHFPQINGNETVCRNFEYDALTGTQNYNLDGSGAFITYSHPQAMHPDHHAAQWIQDVTDATQWYWASNYGDGEAHATGWTQYNGATYQTGINWDPIYLKPTIGIKAVYQTVTGENRLGYTLTAASSPDTVGPGAFFYRDSDQKLFVHLFGDVAPTDPIMGSRIYFFAPTPVHRGVGVRRLDGSDVRLLCHNYAWPGGDDVYEETPFANTSPDGKLVMFTSNMGKMDGRRDVFVAEVPGPTYSLNTLVELPNSDAGPNQGSPFPGAIHYADVDDDPHDGGTTLISFAGGGMKEVFTKADQLSNDDIVTDVKVRWVATKGSGSWTAHAGLVVVDSNLQEHEYYGPTRTLSAIYALYEESFTNNPDTGQPWTVQQVRDAKLIYQQVTITPQLPRARLTEIVLVVTVKRWL